VVGFVVLAFGGFLNYYGFSLYVYGQTLAGALFGGFGGVNYTEEGTIFAFIGVIVVVGGLIVITYGFYSEEKFVGPDNHPVSQPRPSPNTSNPYCPFCGAPVVSGASFCRACGRTLPP